MKIEIKDLKDLAIRAILKTGNIKEADIGKILDVLLFADMTGRSTQGVIKLTGSEPLQTIVATDEIEITKETPVSVQINAHGNPAPLAAHFATEKVIEKCKTSGIGIAGLNGIYSSNGAQAYYADKIARAGFVALVASRSPGAIAPYGGKEPLFGTNPIAFGFPTLKNPLIFDMASSAITWYGLIKAKADGKPIPNDVAIDKNGELTTDPTAVMEGGAILPFDRSYKGAGIAMVVELLGGPLAGATFCNVDVQGKDWGAFILALDTGLFNDAEKFKESASELIKIVKNSKPRSSDVIVSIPGDRSLKFYKEALSTGEVEISDAILSELRDQVK